MMHELIGTILGSQYRIEAKIGQGGMAAVFRAYQLSLDRHVAIKVLPPSFAAKDPDFVKRFQREAKSVAQLNHPNILPVYDFGVDQDYSFIVMRYVEGGQTLSQMLRHPVSHERGIHLVSQIADALAYAHSRGIIHRDVKPSNVLLDNDWALLSDFGLAKVSAYTTRLTGTGRGIGTAAYMSPEQSQGKEIDHRTDIYALGIILYQMLTGKIPHDADSPLAIMLQRINEPAPPPRSLNPNIPESVEQVIMRALARDQDYRYDSATDFAAALKIAATGGVPQQPAANGSRLYQTTIFTPPSNPSSVPASVVPQQAIRERSWVRFFRSPLLAVASVLIAVSAISWTIFASQNENPDSLSSTPVAVGVAESPTATATVTDVPTETATPSPEPPTATATEVAAVVPIEETDTPVPPTETPTLTPTPTIEVTPTDTPTPIVIVQFVTPTPEPTLTPTITPTPAPNGAMFTLLEPSDIADPSYGPIAFEWLWEGPLEPNQGFEVRVWLDGEEPLGAHDAVADNMNGAIQTIDENHYRLQTNIRDAIGVRGRTGIYLWTVALVQVEPSYLDLGIQAQPAELRFDGQSSGNDGGGVGLE